MSNASEPELVVLYQDNHLLAIAKPAGIPVQGGTGVAFSLFDLARAHLKRALGKPGAVWLGIVHRLDREATGVLLFARTSKAASRLSAAIRERRVEKRYRVAVHGRPDPAAGELAGFVQREGFGASACEGGDQGAREARLTYRTIEDHSGWSVLEVDLLTGRKHQIRVQFAAIGCPVIGDRRYGSLFRLPDGSIALHAERLTVPHPTRDERVTIDAPLPEVWRRLPGLPK